ncbi:hypothetical protein ACFMBG_21205 [Leisingera sp. D0M16]|uniref:hypothetical protein n=1 Tax=Leisingera coralii TaxID=3351347 RepID=UPI003B7BFE45
MAHLVVHIGAHKTGTTALQSSFASLDRVLKKHGVLYPKSNWFHYSQHRLSFALKSWADPNRGDVPDFEREAAALNREISRAGLPTAFISSEELFSCSPEAISRFAGAVQAHRVSILAMVRRPDDLLLSIYNQKAKHPGNNFARGLKAFTSDPAILSPDMTQYRCVQNWCDVFGQDSVTVMKYEAASTISQICNFLDLPPQPFEEACAQSNRSVPGTVVEIMRLAKASKLDANKQAKIFRACMSAFAGGAKTYISNQDRRAILTVFEAENDRLFGMFGQENPYKAAIVPEVETEEARPNVTFRDMMALLDQLLN